jgi:hypothetical protein
MGIKMSGADFKRFWAEDSWCFDGQGYVAGDGYAVDGVQTDSFKHEDLHDSAVVEILTGAVYPFDKEEENKDLVAVARAWLRKQETRKVVVEVPTDQMIGFKADIVYRFGAKVLG